MNIVITYNNEKYNINVVGIDNKSDIEEIIHQCQLLKNQLTDELIKLSPHDNIIRGHFLYPK